MAFGIITYSGVGFNLCSYHYMDDLLFYWFRFNQTSKSVDIFDKANHINSNE